MGGFFSHEDRYDSFIGIFGVIIVVPVLVLAVSFFVCCYWDHIDRESSTQRERVWRRRKIARLADELQHDLQLLAARPQCYQLGPVGASPGPNAYYYDCGAATVPRQNPPAATALTGIAPSGTSMIFPAAQQQTLPLPSGGGIPPSTYAYSWPVHHPQPALPYY